jgi:hypothetical protein
VRIFHLSLAALYTHDSETNDWEYDLFARATSFVPVERIDGEDIEDNLTPSPSVELTVQ